MLILALIAIIIIGYIHVKGYTSECTRWALWVLTYLYLRFVRKKPPLFPFDINSTDHGKLGISALPEATLRENPRKLNDHCQAFDCIRIWGGNKDGHLLWMQLSRRHNRHSEVSLYFRSSDGEEYQLPSQPDTSVYNTDGQSFSASGLSFEVLEPLRRWRVNFNGYLRRVKDREIVEANFNFLWTPCSCYVSFPEDFNTLFMANYLSKQSRICPSHFLAQLSTIESHENSGQLHGIVKVGEHSNQMLLRGFKVRSHGYLDWEDVQCKVAIEAFLHDGSAVRLFVDEVGSKRTKFVYGYVLPPCNMSVFHVDHCPNAEVIVKAALHLQHMDISFTAGGFPYRLQLRMRNESQTFHGDDWEVMSKLSLCDVTLNNHTGDGIVELVTRNQSHSPFGKRCSLPLLRELNVKTCKELVVTFGDSVCHSSAVVGGKAASLAMMTNINHDFKEKFVVPSGVSITKTAFEIHLRHNPKIEAAILNLTDVAWSGDRELIKSLQQHCDSVVQLVSQTPISQQLQEELQRALGNTFKEPLDDIKFAVRSSAVGEDGEEMSAAGQNETFLGIKGFQQVCSSISKCWASQFAFRSVEYKRQNGQLLNSGMGVVIQEMVPAQVAGVLFSRNPLTGSYTSMIITSNYGLGESVVSATADPDTITIRRGYDDQLSVQQINTGSKKTIIQMSGESGTEECETEVGAASRCSVSKEDAIRLANIALFLEKCFGNGRDIEWAIVDRHIYILQSRPVTNESPMTDFDVIHEFDTPTRTDDEAYTTANVSEVLPGSQTPLSITTIFRGQMPYFHKRMLWRVDSYKYDPIVIDWMVSCCGHAMFDLIMQKGWCTSDQKDAVLKAFDVGIYGRVLEEGDIMRRALDRFKVRPPLRKRMVMMVAFTLKGMAIGGWLVRSAARQFQNYRIPIDGTENMLDVHRTIQKHVTDLGDICDPHLAVSFASTMWNVIILNILSGSKGDYSTDQYSDFATLIGSCNGAESGNVPASLGELATAISQSQHHTNFSTEEPQVALENIHNSNDPKVKKMFVDFLQRHGHRGMKECDLICKAWGSQPQQLISVLQGMCKSAIHKPREADSSADIIRLLKSPIKPFKKCLLRWVMKYCRQGICYREKAKSLFIKYIDGFRVAYGHLATLMVRQGLLVDPELIYFFTNDELLQLMLTRSPRLIRRAKSRRRLHDYKDKLRFPEVIRGIPKPINDTDEAVSAIDYSEIIKGFPISQGVITAKARVLTSFHDVNTIQPGEILITRATDIGWSPYFPMLAGIVTEIGGLISHGAVVAREFGLPCIVGVDNATKLFQSGDWVLLNATQGTIMKVKHEDD